MLSGANTAAADGEEIIYDCPMLIRAYRGGRVERFFPDNYIPASLDLITGVNSKDCVINPTTGLSARLYLPASVGADEKLPILVYYHGGGFCVMSAFCSLYHDFLNSLAAKAKVIALSVEYRLAPENPIPAAYDDSWEAIDFVTAGAEPWLSAFGNLEKIFLAGDSAGGNIAHNMGMKLGRQGRKAEGVALLHPFFWGDERIGAEGEEREAAMFTAKDADGMWRLAGGGKLGFDDPRLNPFAEDAPSLRELGCRRALVCVAGLDFLRERGRAYYEKLKEDGGWEGKAELAEVDGEDHVFFLFKPRCEKSTAFVERLVNFFRHEE
ncbi:putative carboxylesterase 2 [Platanthera zijinensis]|uniref:Carboxylesterase 2 n=1 Tax=Platanthera zijinensis TaxID=2320716 RepID=A0AAP0BW92_9ASPA